MTTLRDIEVTVVGTKSTQNYEPTVGSQYPSPYSLKGNDSDLTFSFSGVPEGRHALSVKEISIEHSTVKHGHGHDIDVGENSLKFRINV